MHFSKREKIVRKIMLLLLSQGILVYISGWFPITEARRACSTPIAGSILQWVWQNHKNWIFLVYFRNLAMTFTVYTMWHWLLYQSDALKGKMTKFNPVYPSTARWRRDKIMTMSGSIWAASLECVYIYLLGNIECMWPQNCYRRFRAQ